MRTRRTGRIAILLPAATTSLPLRLMSAAAATAHAAGYVIEILGFEGSGSDRVARAQELQDSGEFEGILALAAVGDQPTSGSTTSIVLVSDHDDELRGLGALADGAACGEVVQALVTLGHTQFLHLAGPQDYASARNRRRTFVDSIAQLGVSGTVVNGGWHGQFGYDLVMDLPVDTPITAVVAANDLVATGAIRAALSRGWKVPSDLSVVGWDDNELCRFTTPSLSTVAIDRERQGREAMDRLIALIRGTEPPSPDAASLHTFIPRESIGPAPVRRKRLRVARRTDARVEG
jgi:LacI family repressor for deo operon, udp, cdd, tsx, nupC, and nupG